MIVEIAQRGAPDSSNQCFTRASCPIAAACGRSSGSGQIRVSTGIRSVFAYVNANSIACDDGRWLRRRIAGSRSRSAAMKGPRPFSVAFSISSF